jgi:hypothetical protein
MPYVVIARDGATSRESQEAAEKKAAELREMGCFDVEIIEKANREAQ